MQRMIGLRTAALIAALAVMALPAGAGAAAPAPRAGGESAQLAELLRSRELWATVDVCNPPDQRDYVGIRGSMPGDRHAHDRMYMSFRLQYMDATTKRWVDLGSKEPAFLPVGPGSSVRQGGRSFQVVPRAASPASTFRGVVVFQWRRGSTVIQSATRATSPGRKSLAGADPSGFSAATCTIA